MVEIKNTEIIEKSRMCEIMRTKNAKPQLDRTIIIKLKEEMDSFYTLVSREKYFDIYYLSSAVVGRLELSVDYINKNIKYPFEEYEYINFMLYANMIVDGVKVLYEKIFKQQAYDKEIKYFRHAQEQKILHLSEQEYIDDDRFFEYLRSITFAHPFNTDRNYKNIYGSQVSPKVLPGARMGKIYEDDLDDPVGAFVYSSKKHGYGTNMVIVETSFKQLFAYINSRYLKLNSIIEWFVDVTSTISKN